MKREDYISWNDYFMAVAVLSSMRSKDPSTQTGSAIVKDNKIIGIGYNGFPKGCSDDDFPWERSENILESKISYVVHSEINSILNSNFNMLEGSKMFCTLFPCCDCAKSIIQVGIKEIYYLNNINPNYKDSFKASCRMLDSAGVIYQQYIPTCPLITIKLE